MAPLTRLVLVVAAVGLVLLTSPAQATITASWTDCGGSVKVTNITMSPKNPTVGEKITITTHGVNSMAASTLNMDLTFADIFQNHFDGCKGATIKAPFDLAVVTFPPVHCPLKTGQFESLRYVTLSKDLPKGKTTSKLTGTDSSGNSIVCVDLTLANE